MTLATANLKYEDTLQCFFFSTTNLSQKEWEELSKSINEIIASVAKDYIWHRDEFKTYIPIIKDNLDIPCHLLSITCYGDNVEDEWFIVYIILELTKSYDNLIIQIQDNDGDFLLIEAADYLPAWANPETTENRVFIFNQHLHIISTAEASLDSPLKLEEAIRIVSHNTELTRSSFEIENAIMKRIQGYPQKIEDGCHKAILQLPAEVAAALQLKPSLIAPLVSTYYNIDVLDAKYCKDIHFENLIDAEVKFTKYLYAMLMQSEIPKYFKQSRTKEKKVQLGLKVACAYELITRRMSKDLSFTPEYKKFLISLKKNGYFKDNLEGSVEYLQLLEKAKAYFLDFECSVSLNAFNVINEIKNSDEFNKTTELLKEKSDTKMLEEENDEWMNVDSDQLNEFLNRHYGNNVKLKNKDPITSHILTTELKDFLKTTSSFDGIENSRNESFNNCIDFNADDFVNCLEKMLNIVSNQSISSSDYSSDDNDDDVDCSDNNTELICKSQDLQLASMLKTIENDNVEVNTLKNFSQSLKEEGITGPASTILKSIGVKKSDIVDSDDEM